MFLRPTRVCVFNQTRQSFLSLNTVIADNPLARMRGLIGRSSNRSDSGVWVVPSQGVHTFGLFRPIDLVYLDSDRHVIRPIENVRPFTVAPIVRSAASILQLPGRTVSESQTQAGDTIAIWSDRDLAGDFVAICANDAGQHPHPTNNLTINGALVRANDRWKRGSLVEMTIHRQPGRRAPTSSVANSSHQVSARVLEHTRQGVEVEFEFFSSEERKGMEQFLKSA